MADKWAVVEMRTITYADLLVHKNSLVADNLTQEDAMTIASCIGGTAIDSDKLSDVIFPWDVRLVRILTLAPGIGEPADCEDIYVLARGIGFEQAQEIEDFYNNKILKTPCEVGQLRAVKMVTSYICEEPKPKEGE